MLSSGKRITKSRIVGLSPRKPTHSRDSVMKNSYGPLALARPTTALVMLFFVAACGSGSAARVPDQSESTPEQRTTVRDGRNSGRVSQVQAPELKEYVGSYEGRNISLSGSTLSYKREGMPFPATLKKIEEDHFEVVIPPGARVRGTINGKFPTFRFNRGSSGEVESLSVVNPDKSVQATFKKTE